MAGRGFRLQLLLKQPGFFGAVLTSGNRHPGRDHRALLGAVVVHIWSTRHRNQAVRNGHQRCIFTQVAGAILRKQSRVQNPDKDEVPVQAGLLPAAITYTACRSCFSSSR